MTHLTQADEGALLDRLIPLVKKHLSDQYHGKFTTYLDPFELEQRLSLDQPEGRENWDQVFAYVEKYLQYAVRTNHINFNNRMWSGANLPSMMGEIAVAASNTSACTYEAAPVSTLMEKYLIRRMLEVAGFQDGEGQMTTGSSNANMIAMLAARNKADTAIKHAGLVNRPQLYAFVSEDAHYSMDKAANILGIGTDHLIKVPVNSLGEMDPAHLEQSILDIQHRGGIPFFVAGTAGTTLRGAYDSIKELLSLRLKYRFWLHMDGAWGGAAVLSRYLRERFLKGIEQVDSFTWDFHKMPGTALICNVLLLNNNAGTLGRLCRDGDTSYIFRDDAGSHGESFNLGAFSLQCGRRVDSLKWFLDWKYYGQAGFARKVERFYHLCEYAEEIVHKTPELEMVVPRNSFNVCFRYKAPPHLSNNDFNLKLRTMLYHQGISLVGFGYVKSQLCLRLLITNSRMEQAHVKTFFDQVVKTAARLLETV